MARDHILLIDTSEQACTLALFKENQVVAHISEVQPRKHGDLLLPTCQSLFEQVSIDSTRIQAIAVTTGPGAFTGIRIGVAMVQGLAYGWGVPCISMNTLDLWAATALKVNPSADFFLAAMDARMGEIYTRLYKKDSTAKRVEPITDSLCVSAENLASHFEHHTSFSGSILGLVGSGIKPYMEQLEAVIANKQGKSLALDLELSLQAYGELATERFNQGQTVSALELDALYLRPAVI
ncbi:MAG TPA: tRNA (adenosine(37)-N6)-threonylcarbamoyltransferase complex dimerization subunit type 1 TsaB [Gammaproteobacteria bacterium]|nr:tRNA (adenosine(37)-N6)-threonylcarbamoyltransferase complex dimerization subunit type 1 TsaB [Gammaproteobacteria bacterium]HBF08324.1 tRNA (adenosine(37)-N6)-threonylcarbamoyltransferase complex dimerization subunit type 1 TsaB [Gammaproteobacteria bacterium]HCK92401.1 tRNA (adenosine(37)-N6)-threonylcarbamoyltransferase complex dimerization subunit type 1 TsaB [Gammaproteobacteria bacterium]|tara:strand:- start:3974 stop:4684 length:711 start_codon:yes stop_codon:yes gene_type:complete